MKKILTLLIIGILCLCSLVAATGNGNGDATNSQTQNAGEESTIQEQNEFRNQLTEHESGVQGLENAQLRVQSEESKADLEQVMNKIQTQTREKLNAKESLELEESIDGTYEVKFKDDAKFLGLLQMKKQFTYELGEDGFLHYQKGPWDFLFSQENPLELE